MLGKVKETISWGALWFWAFFVSLVLLLSLQKNYIGINNADLLTITKIILILSFCSLAGKALLYAVNDFRLFIAEEFLAFIDVSTGDKNRKEISAPPTSPYPKKQIDQKNNNKRIRIYFYLIISLTALLCSKQILIIANGMLATIQFGKEIDKDIFRAFFSVISALCFAAIYFRGLYSFLKNLISDGKEIFNSLIKNTEEVVSKALKDVSKNGDEEMPNPFNAKAFFYMFIFAAIYMSSSQVSELIHGMYQGLGGDSSINTLNVEKYIKSLTRFLVVIFGSLFFIGLASPQLSLVLYRFQSIYTVKEWKEDIKRAQEISQELLSRILDALPFKGILLAASGASNRHIHTTEDEGKQRKLGALIILVSIYSFFSMYIYINGSPKQLIDTFNPHHDLYLSSTDRVDFVYKSPLPPSTTIPITNLTVSIPHYGSSGISFKSPNVVFENLPPSSTSITSPSPPPTLLSGLLVSSSNNRVDFTTNPIPAGSEVHIHRDLDNWNLKLGEKGADPENSGISHHLLQISRNLLVDYAALVSLIFALFIFFIDRMIVSDHSLEYRLFLIRFQELEMNGSMKEQGFIWPSGAKPSVWANQLRPPYLDPTPPVKPTNFRGKIKYRVKQVLLLPYTIFSYIYNLFLYRSKPVPLGNTPRNSKEWHWDAAALFHPRAFISVLFPLAFRGAVAFLTAYLASTAFVFIIFDNDIKQEVGILADSYRNELETCESSIPSSKGCKLLEAKQAKNKSEALVDFYQKLSAAESQPTGKRSLFCLIEEPQGNYKVRDQEIGINERADRQACAGKFSLADTDISEGNASTGKQTDPNNAQVNQVQQQHQSSVNKEIQNRTQKAAELAEKEKEISDLVENFKHSISTRLLALERVKLGVSSPRTPEGDAYFSTTLIDPSHWSDFSLVLGNPTWWGDFAKILLNKPDHSLIGQAISLAKKRVNNVEQYLFCLLMAFELFPLFFIKIQPFFGWIPSTYIYSYCYEKYVNESNFIGKIRDFPEGFKGGIDAHKHRGMSSTDLVVELLFKLKLPMFVLITVGSIFWLVSSELQKFLIK